MIDADTREYLSREWDNRDPASHRGSLARIHGNLIIFRRYAARHDEDPFVVFNIADMRLPPSPFCSSCTTLAEHDHLRGLISEVAVAIGARIDPKAKSGHTRLSSVLSTVSKLIEYGWLNGCYRGDDWSPALTERLLTELGTGGWAKALDLASRSRKLFEGTPPAMLRELIHPSKSLGLQWSLASAQICELLGTNAGSHELFGVKQSLMQRLGLDGEDLSSNTTVRTRRPRLRSETAGMSQSQLRQELANINLAAECSEKYGLDFVPYDDTVRLSKEFGRKGRRTRNLPPESIAKLLKEAVWWLKTMATPVLHAVAVGRMGIEESKKAKRLLTPAGLHQYIRQSGALGAIEELIDVNITTLGKGRTADTTSLKEIVYTLATACFITLAFMNARRRDELQHRKIGVYRDALEEVDTKLGIYRCFFYIEKTVLDYVPFYVGPLSRNAIEVLKQLSDLARQIDRTRAVKAGSPDSGDARELKLFELPRLVGKGDGGGMQWYNFAATSEGAARDFIERALGEGFSDALTSHMFRRAHALIHHYRFENSTLQALSQQLGHFDLEQTLVYVQDRDVASGEHSATSYGKLTPQQAKAHAARLSENLADVEEVAKQRVHELVSEVVNGSRNPRGGFANLVRRFHQVMAKRMDFSALDRREQSKKLSESLCERGHKFRPMRHANCVATDDRTNNRAGCFNRRLGRVAREDATAQTCTHCPYSHWLEAHTAALVEDCTTMKRLVEQAGPDTVQRQQATVSLENIEKIILYRQRQTGMT